MNTQTSNGVNDKVKQLADLSGIVSELKTQGKRIVHCHGVFDLVHPGHIRYLESAGREGDVLVVTVTGDDYVDKGPGRPVFNQRLRAETLGALQTVDFVAISECHTSAEAVRSLRPDVYVEGKEDDEGTTRNGHVPNEDVREAIRSVGARLKFIKDITFSSTKLLNAHFEVFPPETHAYLQEFRNKYSASDVIERLRKLKNLKVLVVGDAIIDEYHFCRPYGIASKSSAVAAQFLEAEAYAGGCLAVANHLANFCDDVALLTCLGAQDSREEFIRQSLKRNVAAKFFYREGAPTMVKRRYVQGFLATKLFEVSFFNDQPLSHNVNREFCDYLSETVGDYDLVVTTDFGHGLMGPLSIDVLDRNCRFLAVNAQLNSVNKGYNVIVKYPRADYICIDEQEARMAARTQYGPLEHLMTQLAHQLNSRIMTVTLGHRGSTIYEAGNGFVSIPVLSREVVDPIGAGDAYLAISSACASMGYPPELIGFVGNAVGALAVRIMGNKESVGSDSLFRFIETLLR